MLVRFDSGITTMYANSGVDIWYYDWLPTASQVANGLRATFAAQVAAYHREGK